MEWRGAHWSRFPDSEPIGQSAVMREVITGAQEVARTQTTVLLLGESGTGKEVLARYIHWLSRRSGAWVAVNCAALPSELLESELFGHERGAFTGAAERRCGRIEQANGGTLLLDEVSELPMRLQPKLLRVLQEREVDRIGGQRPIPVDVRIIATSNRHLQERVAEKLFRADLYYRLNVFPIALPPLRGRTEDIPALATHLLRLASEALGRPPPALSEAAVRALQNYPFPGNVRELANVLERALVRSRGPVLNLGDLGRTTSEGMEAGAAPAAPSVSGLPSDFPLDLAELERRAITEALRRMNGNRTHAARILGIGLRTLRNKLKLYRENLGAQGPVDFAAGQVEPVASSPGPRQTAEFSSAPAQARASQPESV